MAAPVFVEQLKEWLAQLELATGAAKIRYDAADKKLEETHADRNAAMNWYHSCKNAAKALADVIHEWEKPDKSEIEF